MKQHAYVPTLMMISLQNCIKQIPKELKELKDPVKETEHQRTSIVLKQLGLPLLTQKNPADIVYKQCFDE